MIEKKDNNCFENGFNLFKMIRPQKILNKIFSDESN